MIDLTRQINLAQISFGIAVIALVVVWYVFGKKPTRPKR